MKLFTNLPGNLRALFGFLRILTIAFGLCWVLGLTVNTWLHYGFGQEAKFMVTMGEISLPTAPDAVGLSSNSAKPGSLGLLSLRGTLQADLCSQDAALVSALRQTILPFMAISIFFSYVLFTSLRNLCANLEVGDVFNEENLRLVRRIGVTLIVYSLAGIAAGFWSSAVLGIYFQEHVVLTGLKTTLQFPHGPATLQVGLTPGFLTNQGGLMTGCLVLVAAEAFRQGLNLKTENDLTV